MCIVDGVLITRWLEFIYFGRPNNECFVRPFITSPPNDSIMAREAAYVSDSSGGSSGLYTALR
jgi:hypothetical protein